MFRFIITLLSESRLGHTLIVSLCLHSLSASWVLLLPGIANSEEAKNAAPIAIDVKLAAEVMAVAMSPNGQRIAIIQRPRSTEGKPDRDVLTLWSPGDGKGRSFSLAESEKGAAPRHVAFSTDGKLVVAATRNRIRVIRFDSGQPIGADVHGTLLQLVGDTAAVLLEPNRDNNRIGTIFDIKTMVPKSDLGGLVEMPLHPINDYPPLAISSNETTVAVAENRILRMIDMAKGTARPETTFPKLLCGVAIDLSGAHVAVALATENLASPTSIEILDWSDPRQPARLLTRITPDRANPKEPIILPSRDFLHGLHFLDADTLAVLYGTQLLIWDIPTNKQLDVAPALNDKGFNYRTPNSQLLPLKQSTFFYDKSQRKLGRSIHTQIVPGSSHGIPHEWPRMGHSIDLGMYAFKSNHNVVSVRSAPKIKENFSVLSESRINNNVYPVEFRVNEYHLELSGDGVLACAYRRSNSGEFNAIYDTATGSMRPVTHAEVLLAKKIRGSGSATILPVIHLDTTAHQLVQLHFAHNSIGKGVNQRKSRENFWINTPVSEGPHSISKIAWQTPLEPELTEVSPVFQYPGKGLALAVQFAPLRQKDIDREHLQLVILEIPSGKLIKLLEKDLGRRKYSGYGFRNRVIVSSDGTRVGWLDEEAVRVWDTVTGAELRCTATCNKSEFVTFALGGKQLCVVRGKFIERTDLDGGKYLAPVAAGEVDHAEVAAIAPVAPRYLVHTRYGHLEWRSLDDGSLVTIPDAVTADLTAAHLSADGKVMGTISSDSIVRFWSVPEVSTKESKVTPTIVSFPE